MPFNKPNQAPNPPPTPPYPLPLRLRRARQRRTLLCTRALRGQRSGAGTAQPKQYQPIAGQPLVMHTLRALAGVARLHGGLVVLTPG
jgi:hypothetical protein